MVKIRPSTEEIEMHDLYSMDYGRMISETNRETSVIIPLLITVLFQIKTLVTYVK